MSFQFHKGSIKTELHNVIELGVEVFQFHKGSIKTYRGKMIESYFSLFQFHKGSIKTMPQTVSSVTFRHFNSIKVRLRHVVAYLEVDGVRISIP